MSIVPISLNGKNEGLIPDNVQTTAPTRYQPDDRSVAFCVVDNLDRNMVRSDHDLVKSHPTGSDHDLVKSHPTAEDLITT